MNELEFRTAETRAGAPRVTKSQRAYMYHWEGKTWKEIADIMNWKAYWTARQLAIQYAIPRGLPMRVKPKHHGRRKGTKREAAYKLRMERDLPWKDIARLLGYASPGSARNEVLAYALSWDLLLPKKRRKGRGKL